MQFRSILTLAASSAALVTVLATGSASAQPGPAQPAAPAEPKDGARFRGGVALEGGALLVPGVINLGLAGVQGQLGAQINNNFGVYAVPSFAVVFGSLGGIHLGAAVMVDYTFLDNLLTVGIGPDFASFAAIGGSSSGVSAAGGGLYGARLHFAINPAVSIGDNGIRRKALTIGVDLRLYTGGAGFASSGTNGASAAVSEFVAAPTLSLGYNAF